MRSIAAIVCGVVLSVGTASAADKPSPVTIGAITLDPTSPATLHYLGQVYVGVHYHSTIPVKIVAALENSADFHQYTPVISLIIGKTSAYAAGEGDALCAISPTPGRAADADTITIIIKSAETDEQLKVIHIPVAFSWDTQHVPKPEPADWVKALVKKLYPPKQQ